MLKKRKHKLKSGTKTYKRSAWEFRRSLKQIRKVLSDFIVCIYYESEDTTKEPRCFIIPSGELINEKTQKPHIVWSISIAPKGKSKFWEWKNRSDLIVR